MENWRTAASDEAQSDLDELFGAVVPYAEKQLTAHGAFSPFGAEVSADGELTLFAVDGLLDDVEGEPDPGDVLKPLYEAAGSGRAAAVVAAVSLEERDAIQVELEHRDGLALVALIPYQLGPDSSPVSLGEITASAGRRTIWSE